MSDVIHDTTTTGGVLTNNSSACNGVKKRGALGARSSLDGLDAQLQHGRSNGHADAAVLFVGTDEFGKGWGEEGRRDGDRW